MMKQKNASKDLHELALALSKDYDDVKVTENSVTRPVFTRKQSHAWSLMVKDHLKQEQENPDFFAKMADAKEVLWMWRRFSHYTNGFTEEELLKKCIALPH